MEHILISLTSRCFPNGSHRTCLVVSLLRRTEPDIEETQWLSDFEDVLNSRSPATTNLPNTRTTLTSTQPLNTSELGTPRRNQGDETPY